MKDDSTANYYYVIYIAFLKGHLWENVLLELESERVKQPMSYESLLPVSIFCRAISEVGLGAALLYPLARAKPRDFWRPRPTRARERARASSST